MKLRKTASTAKPPVMDKSRLAATIVFRDAARMSKSERAQVASWLRMHAREIMTKADRYASRMTARRYL